MALPSKPVTETTIVAATFLGTVGSMETLWAWQGTNDTLGVGGESHLILLMTLRPL